MNINKYELEEITELEQITIIGGHDGAAFYFGKFCGKIIKAAANIGEEVIKIFLTRKL